MNANMNGFDKALFKEKYVFRCSIIDVGKSVYSCQLSVIWAHEDQQKTWHLAVAANGWHDWAIRKFDASLLLVDA